MTLRQACGRDARRGAALAAAGALAWAPVEFVASLVSAPGSVRFATGLRFALLDVALIAVAAALLAAALIATLVGSRLAYAAANPAAAREWPGLGLGRRTEATAPRLWAAALWLAGYGATSTALTLLMTARFKAPVVTAIALTMAQVALVALWGLVAFVASGLLARLGRATVSTLPAAVHPLRSPVAAGTGIAALAAVAAFLTLRAAPQLAPLVPWRWLLAAASVAIGMSQRHRLARALPGPGRIRRGLLLGAPIAVVAALVLTGGHPDTKYLATTASPVLDRVIDIVRVASDVDGDGYSSVLGEGDCAPFDGSIHPYAADLPDNGIDEDCNGRDFSPSKLPSYAAGNTPPVPAEFVRDWNVLFITVDTLRADRLGYAGFAERTGRDLTPNLDALAARSVAFTDAHAPSAGTVASVPAILTSRFFHSGIALSGERRPKPPKILDDNVLLAEVMKRAGYTTGAILTHEYFNDWGLEQGFDTYDNELGARRDPFSITSPGVTDKALAWMARHADRKWFLWAHYLDPHGRYVAHGGEPSFGDTEEDLYDGEVRFTDRHLGRLLAELRRIPGGDRTVIIVTSDHGDGFKEHGFINHGMALFREMIAVPLIVHVPGLPARMAAGAVTPLDVLPTIADLCGIDIADLAPEGRSLAGPLFYRRDDLDRVVFSETNFPHPQRAAITADHKLILNMKANVFELFDRRKDPWEKTNVWRRGGADAERMKRYLDDWLERVVFARDERTNQAQAKRRFNLLSSRPRPEHPLDPPASFDNGAVRVLGYRLDHPTFAASDTVAITVYLEVLRPPSGDFRLQGVLRNAGGKTANGGAKLTANGLFPSGRWRAGDFVRDVVKVRVPAAWATGDVDLGLRLIGAQLDNADDSRGMAWLGAAPLVAK